MSHRGRRVLLIVQIASLVVVSITTALRAHVLSPIDEKQHYAYVQSIADDGRLPLLEDHVSPELQAISTGAWPRRTPVEPSDRDLSVFQYEAFQPPAYYALAAPVFAATPGYRNKVFAVRLLGVVLLLASVGFLWLLARAIRPQAAPMALAGGLVVTLWPGVVTRATTISPSALELLLVPALLLACHHVRTVGTRRWLIALGVLLGLVLLTRLTLVFLVPVALWSLLGARRDRIGVALALVVPVLMLSPWLIANHARYGSLTAAVQARAQQRAVVDPKSSYGVSDVVHFTGQLFDNVLATEQDGRREVWWVRIVAVPLAIALFALAFTRDRATWAFAAPILLGYALMVWVLLVDGWPSFHLRYLYPALPAFAVVGAGRLGARAWTGIAVCTVLLGLLWIDVAGAYYFTDVGAKLGI